MNIYKMPTELEELFEHCIETGKFQRLTKDRDNLPFLYCSVHHPDKEDPQYCPCLGQMKQAKLYEFITEHYECTKCLQH